MGAHLCYNKLIVLTKKTLDSNVTRFAMLHIDSYPYLEKCHFMTWVHLSRCQISYLGKKSAKFFFLWMSCNKFVHGRLEDAHLITPSNDDVEVEGNHT